MRARSDDDGSHAQARAHEPHRMTPQPYLGLVPPSALQALKHNDGEVDRQPRHPEPPRALPSMTPRPYLGLVPPSQSKMVWRSDDDGAHVQARAPPPASVRTPAPFLGLVPPGSSRHQMML
eukprot:gene4937-3552_t